MQVWAISYQPSSITEDLYQRALPLVDPESRSRIQRFYRREDACRCLIGRLLPRMLLRERGVRPELMKFGATEAGKPYITSSGIDPPIGFNVSHDSGMVVMAFAEGRCDPPAYRIGVDVMEVKLPPRDTFRGFVHTVGDQLTSLEHRLLLSPGIDPQEALRRFYLLWTMKEAYTKALGLGLGFEFRRVEYNVPDNVLTVDGVVPKGWEFVVFDLNQETTRYVGVAARLVGGEATQLTHYDPTTDGEWLSRFDASTFIEKAIDELH
ncbi:4'-phosphopantetheinyl transferase [Heliocybe sulcata]|uniref:holo-[acyl-carrier-protein] synthase n=1 Tax=Heliocybe sulcata TaxID=5364 RepID=A0A5C3NFD5_9AGAM|nr:4'-phosphopantetheinyl transferase [Heliocybe sulcata]